MVPKTIRAPARPKPGTHIGFRPVSGDTELEWEPPTESTARRGHLVVAVSHRNLPALAGSVAEDTMTALRHTESVPPSGCQ